MQNLEKANKLINAFSERINNPLPFEENGDLFTGIDLGTAYIVLAVIDSSGAPVAGAMRYASVVRDGIVVDYMGALDIVRDLKAQLEKKLGHELGPAAAAYPPGTKESVQKTITYIAEAAGLDMRAIVDEPTAANSILGVKNGAVVDIGGGTTGTAVIKDGKVIHVDDDPTGGTHLSLVIAGGKNISFEDAELLKTNPENHKDLLPMVTPVMEKIGGIIRNHTRGYSVDAVYLAGGTSCFKGIDRVIEKEIGLPVYIPANPFLVTPLGIALNAVQK